MNVMKFDVTQTSYFLISYSWKSDELCVNRVSRASRDLKIWNNQISTILARTLGVL